MHQPRKRFGQHFLHDPGVIQRIVDAIAPQPDQRLVEIGPGRGALTLPLLTAAGELDVVELDRDLLPLLEQRCRDVGVLRIHGADALKYDFCALAPPASKLRLTGNLPYNISTPLLFHLLTQARCIQDMHFMLQKEVVDRMAAGPGDKTYGRLSVMIQLRCQVIPLFDIGPGAFQPPPKVQSSLVRLCPYTTLPVAVDDLQLLGRLVTQAFGRRRKTLRNALRGLLDAEQIRSTGIDPGQRPECLDLKEFAALSNLLSTATGQPPSKDTD